MDCQQAQYNGTANVEAMEQAVRYNEFLYGLLRASIPLDRACSTSAQVLAASPQIPCSRSAIWCACGHVRRYIRRELVERCGLVRLYDRLIFPVSRMLDRLTGRLFGKNVTLRAPPAPGKLSASDKLARF